MTTAFGIDRNGIASGTGAPTLTGSLNALADPNADRIVFWDESAGRLEWLTAGSNLTISGTTLSVSGVLDTLAGLAVTDGNFVVGDGAAWVVESGNTARTSLGLGTGDAVTHSNLTATNLTVATIDLGSTDTTLSRASAGDINVEGNRIFRVGGAVVPLADGGTGASSALTARTSLGLGTGDAVTHSNLTVGFLTTTVVNTTNAFAGFVVVRGTNQGGVDANTSVIDNNVGQCRLFSYGPNASTNGEFHFNSQRSDGTNTLLPLQSDTAGNLQACGTLDLGGTSDATLARASAGDINVEGNRIFRVGGAVVPLADGGTGASSALTARTSLGLGTGDAVTHSNLTVGFLTTTVVNTTNAFAGFVVVRGTNQGGVDANTSVIDNNVGQCRLFSYGPNASTNGEFHFNSQRSDGTNTLLPLQSDTAGNLQACGTLDLGGTSDATLARASAGDINVEGNRVFRVGGADVPLADGGTGASLADPAADRIMFWDDSEGVVAWLTAGSGLTISGSTLTATSAGITNGTPQATTSGSGFIFSVATGVKSIRVMCDAVSLSGTDDLLIQLGTASGLVITNYTSRSSSAGGGTSSSAGFICALGIAADTEVAVITLDLMDTTSNIWMSTHHAVRSSDSVNFYGVGRVALPLELSQIKLTRTGTDNFDAGSVNIAYQ